MGKGINSSVSVCCYLEGGSPLEAFKQPSTYEATVKNNKNGNNSQLKM